MGKAHMLDNENFIDNPIETYLVSLNYISVLLHVEDRQDMSLSEYELDCLLLSSI